MLEFPAQPKSERMSAHCTDPLIGNILAGWRYDISHLSPAMRADYDHHLVECAHCRRRQHIARTVDFLLLSVSTLSIVAFLLATAVLHKIEVLAHLGSKFHGHFHHTPVTISLEAVAIAGLAISILLWVVIASITPVPAIVSAAVQQRLPQSVRERWMKDAA
jgi:hypothetical protein